MQLRIVWTALLALLICSTSPFAAANAFETQENDQSIVPIASGQQHGPPELLIEKMIRVRELEILLREATPNSDGQLSQPALQALQKIFEYPADVFEVDADTGHSVSIRRQALGILRNAPPASQRQWMQLLAAPAESHLRRAIQSGNRLELNAVARQFPATEPGITAALLSLTLDYLHDSHADFHERLKQFEADCAGTVLQSWMAQRARALRGHFDSESAAERKPSLRPHPRIIHSSLETGIERGSLAPPWPIAAWQWQEAIWNYPGAPQPEAGTELQPFLPGLATSLNEFNNWRPVYWGKHIVLRTPFRLVAFERVGGRLVWSLPTNTYVPEPASGDTDSSSGDSMSGRTLRRPDQPSSLGGLPEFGLFSHDDDYLFFIDRFDFFRSGTLFETRRNRFRRIPFGQLNLVEDDFDSTQTATRLVALKRNSNGDLPGVAWIAGEESDFSYNVAAIDQPGSTDTQESTTVSGSPEQPETVWRMAASAKNATIPRSVSLAGHQFLSGPAGDGDRLFVLTKFDNQYCINCLMRTSGQLMWTQPLVYSDSQMDVPGWDQSYSNNASVCLLSGDTVVCALSEGVLVGVRPTDGQLMWATVVREPPEPPESGGFRRFVPDDAVVEDRTSVILPYCNDHILVSANSKSPRIYGVDTRSGAILWHSARRAHGLGDAGGSADHYIAGIDESQVVLIGARHCRSLDLRTGLQNWVVSIGRTSGRAECRSGRCLIPQRDGQILSINISDGSLRRVIESFLPTGAQSPFGAITSDQEFVCAATPVSLVVYPRVDTELQQLKTRALAADGNTDVALQQVQAHLINGDVEQAFAILQAAAASSKISAPGDRAVFEEFLGELILQEWGEKFAATPDRDGATALAIAGNSDKVRMLPQLNLTSEQQLRAAVLLLLSHSEDEVSATEVEELTAFPEWKAPIMISDGWSVRPDLLLNHAVAAGKISGEEIEGLSAKRLRGLAEEASLFPQLIDSDASRVRLVKRLTALGEYPHAEAVLASWSVSSESRLADELLLKLRGNDSLQDGEPDDESAGPPEIVNSESAVVPGLTSSAKSPVFFDTSFYLRIPSWESQVVDKGLALQSLPDWVRPRYYLVDGQDGLPDLVSLDPSDGTIPDRVPLTFGFNRNALGFQQINNARLTPALLPVAGAEQMSMIACTVPGKAKTLWTRRWRQAGEEESAMEFGSLGSDHFVWQSSNHLHCSHPLTGAELWVRRLPIMSDEQPLPGARRIFGDHRATVVMGADSTSFERYSTRDGRRLGAGRLDIGRGGAAQTIGRCLLYQDIHDRLHLFDGATGRDELVDDEPVFLGAVNPERMIQPLTDNRVLVISRTFELVLIDCREGRILFRRPAVEHVTTNSVFGVTAFERNGRLFVGLDIVQNPIRQGFDFSLRAQEPQMGLGPLICLDPVSGEILWATTLNGATFPEVNGDPTDLLVSWNIPGNDAGLRRSGGPEPLEVRLISGITGAVLTSEFVPASRPIRCVHVAESSTIELITRDGVIEIHP